MLPKKYLLPFVNDDPRVDQIWPARSVGWRLDHRLDEPFRNVIALHEIGAFLEVGWDERQELCRLGITRSWVGPTAYSKSLSVGNWRLPMKWILPR